MDKFMVHGNLICHEHCRVQLVPIILILVKFGHTDVHTFIHL